MSFRPGACAAVCTERLAEAYGGLGGGGGETHGRAAAAVRQASHRAAHLAAADEVLARVQPVGGPRAAPVRPPWRQGGCAKSIPEASRAAVVNVRLCRTVSGKRCSRQRWGEWRKRRCIVGWRVIGRLDKVSPYPGIAKGRYANIDDRGGRLVYSVERIRWIGQACNVTLDLHVDLES